MTSWRVVHAERSLGAALTIEIRDRGDWADALGEVGGWLRHVDTVFGLDQPDSDVGLLRRAQGLVEDADPRLAEALTLCVRARRAPGGGCSAPSSRAELAALMRALAAERASGILREHGSGNHAVSAEGGVQLAGEAEPGRPWAIPVADPRDRRRILTVVGVRDLAIATAAPGTRRTQIIEPPSGQPTTALASATVIGPSLTLASAYTNAAYAIGPRATAWFDRVASYESLLVTFGGSVSRSRRWDSAIARHG